jgi:hypothetical protein
MLRAGVAVKVHRKWAASAWGVASLACGVVYAVLPESLIGQVSCWVVAVAGLVTAAVLPKGKPPRQRGATVPVQDITDDLADQKSSQSLTNAPAVGPDAILIDDDELVHMCWRLAAEHRQRQLVTFKTTADFLARADAFPSGTPVFIDFNLGPGECGQTCAQAVHARGFENLTLVTGFGEQELPDIPWVREIRGKAPPF